MSSSTSVGSISGSSVPAWLQASTDSSLDYPNHGLPWAVVVYTLSMLLLIWGLNKYLTLVSPDQRNVYQTSLGYSTLIYSTLVFFTYFSFPIWSERSCAAVVLGDIIISTLLRDISLGYFVYRYTLFVSKDTFLNSERIKARVSKSLITFSNTMLMTLTTLINPDNPIDICISSDVLL